MTAEARLPQERLPRAGSGAEVLDWRGPQAGAWPEGGRGRADAGGEAAPARRARKWHVRVGREVYVPIGLFVLMVLLALAHQGRVIELAYPVLAFGIALWLYRWYPVHYLGFVCWLFFLTPEVRRLADFVNGMFNPVSPVMVTPMLCAALSGLAVLTNVRLLAQRRAMPLMLVMSALLYAYAIGIVRAGFSAATFGLVSAVFPALVGFRLVACWKDYPEYQRVLLNTFVFACIVMGAYGVYEFISPPPWDAFWLIQAGMKNEGDPIPFGWRVAGTMNSSGPFANTLIVCIVMSLAGRGKLRMAAGIALPALMFTSVRSAWGGMLLGLIYPIAMLDGRSRMRIIASVLVCIGLCAPVAMFSDAADRFTSRLSTVQNLSEDNSFQVRMSMYSVFFTKALSDVAGKGFGGTGVASKLADDQDDVILVFDSGIMEVPYVMGWSGTLLYVSGIVILLKRAFSASRKQPHDRIGACGVGIAYSTVVMMLFANTLTGPTGMFFFIGVLLPVNGLRYHRHMREMAQRPPPAETGDAARPSGSAPPPRYGAFDGSRPPVGAGVLS